MCKYSTPFTDENGQYECYLCMKDWEVCDGQCYLHLEKKSDILELLKKKEVINYGIR